MKLGIIGCGHIGMKRAAADKELLKYFRTRKPVELFGLDLENVKVSKLETFLRLMRILWSLPPRTISSRPSRLRR